MLKYLYYRIKEKIHTANMKRKYPDYKDDCYNYDNLKFIWGVKSHDDFTSTSANIWTMNDLEITYDRDTKEYLLGIETIYHFENGYKGEIEYLEGLLDKFTEFVEERGCMVPNVRIHLGYVESLEPWRAETISELYLRFKVFVKGYQALYES